MSVSGMNIPSVSACVREAAGVSRPTIGLVYSPPSIAPRSPLAVVKRPWASHSPRKGPPTGRPGLKPDWGPPLRGPPLLAMAPRFEPQGSKSHRIIRRGFVPPASAPYLGEVAGESFCPLQEMVLDYPFFPAFHLLSFLTFLFLEKCQVSGLFPFLPWMPPPSPPFTDIYLRTFPQVLNLGLTKPKTVCICPND